ncbi:MAG TPA: DUF5329 domain-containing protein [Steroidobacteraceae bacterium]|nr:DUF5329 domain-containing protein [Steroidobacteraceae bacterium]
MTVRPRVILGTLALLALGYGTAAAAPSVAQVEIDYLLGFVEQSNCEFYRNGSSYDAAQAGSHLREKYAALAAAGRILTGDEFIDKVASRSSLSGRPYEVKCTGHARMSTAPWLREALMRFRTMGAPRELRDAR